jgi:hypothetical protein
MSKEIHYPYEIEPGLVVLAPDLESPGTSISTVSEDVWLIMEGVNLLNRSSGIQHDPFEALQRLWYYETQDGDWLPVTMTIDAQ